MSSTDSPLIQQASIKLFFTDESKPNLEEFIPVFHKWIRENKISDQLLIDVADYSHVPNGPGVMLVAHEAHYGIDARDGESGLLYGRKRDAIGPANEALKGALKRAVTAALLIEGEPLIAKHLRFRTDNLELQIMSRLTAPNTPETQAAIEPVWASLLSDCGYADSKFATPTDRRRAFGLRRADAPAPDLATLRSAL